MNRIRMNRIRMNRIRMNRIRMNRIEPPYTIFGVAKYVKQNGILSYLNLCQTPQQVSQPAGLHISDVRGWLKW